ncbi:MAG: LysR family transcriptional regulator [Endozoicomonas sp.]
MPRTSLEQLSAFVAVAESGSFSKAAKAIRKDRATLHHQVGNLEIDWGLRLFDRGGRAPKLTAEGERLLTRAKHILYQLDSLENDCDTLAAGDEQEITLFHDISVDCEMIRQISSELQNAFPHTDLNWIHRDRQESIQALLNREADFALVLNSGKVLPTGGLSFINLGYPRFAFFAHNNAPLALKDRISLSDLETHRQYIAENFADILVGAKLSISAHTATVSNIDVLMALLKNGGYALLPCHLVEAELYRDQYRKLDINFMVQDGRAGYVLLSRSLVGISRVKQFLVERIADVFRQLG